jgi:molybdopterin converting factor small subunit
MPVTVLVPGQLAARLNGSASVEIEASDLLTTLETLSRHCQLDDGLLRDDGHLQAYVRVAVNRERVTARKPEDLQRVAVAGKTVEIAVALAGG